MISPQKRQEIIDALRHGTVPGSSLDAFAVGLEGFAATLDEELYKVRTGGSVFKAVRGEYGCGKTFFARWLADRARKMGFATSEVQIAGALLRVGGGLHLHLKQSFEGAIDPGKSQV